MSRGSLQFRLATDADAGALGEFMARNFLATYGHCSSPENVQAAITEHYGEAAQLRQVRDASRVNLVALQGGTWIGHAQLKQGGCIPAGIDAVPATELARFYIDASCHGNGTAQAMMVETKKLASLHGAASLYLSVWKEAHQAIRFYEKEGFGIAGELVFMVGNDPKDDWLMTCILEAPAAPKTGAGH